LTYEKCIKNAALVAQIPQALLEVGRVDVVQDSRWNWLWRWVDPNSSAPGGLSLDARPAEASDIVHWRLRTCWLRSAAVAAPPWSHSGIGCPSTSWGRGEESVILRSRSRPLKQSVVAARHEPDEWPIWVRETLLWIHQSHRNLLPGFHCQLHYRSPQNARHSPIGKSRARSSSKRVETHETLRPNPLVHQPTDTAQRKRMIAVPMALTN
jgi:hypothetical protein